MNQVRLLDLDANLLMPSLPTRQLTFYFVPDLFNFYNSFDAEEGETYWIDPDTGKATWQKPESLAWILTEKEDGKT